MAEAETALTAARARKAAAAPRPAPPSTAQDSPRAIEADDYWPAQGFVAASLGLALIPELALGVRHDDVAIRRLHSASQPERRIFAVNRAAVSGTTPVQTMITTLKAQADPHRR